MEKINSFEYLRVIAIMCIVIDHYIGGPIGRYLGETFICVFFCLSALLFGLKWEKAGRPKYSYYSFLYPRILRILVAYYPFLIVSLILLQLLYIPFSLTDTLMNFALLSWFSKLPYLGHLWFLTMIVMCYVMFVLLSKVHIYINYIRLALLLCFSLFLQVIVQEQGLPGYVFLMLFYSGLLFLKADKFLDIIKEIKLGQFLLAYLIINTFALMCFYNGVFEYSPVLSKWLGTICGFSNVILFIKIFDNAKQNNLIKAFSIISFEIYLVHNPLCALKPFLIDYFNSPSFAFVVFCVITIVCAIILNKISKFIINNFISTKKTKEVST
jgi:peptidoglycan/LPS O-acetylase OafA/YrhL